MGQMKELSVVIVTYNSEPDIYRCLDALFAHNDLDDAKMRLRGCTAGK